MIDLTRTTTQLLNGLSDPEDQAVWTEFDGRYRPVIFNFARKLGMSDADAADVAQETLLQFAREYREGRYDRGRGRLRSWIITIARYKVAGVRRGRATRGEARGQSAMVNLENEAAMTRIWESERRTVILRTAMDRLRDTRTSDVTIRAFELLVHHQQPPATVAETLGVTVHDVYLAKSRCAQRLRGIIEELEAAYEGD